MTTTATIKPPGLLQRLVLPVLAAAAAVGLYIAWNIIAAWCQKHFGFRNGDGNSPYYLFWSGAGSDLGYWSFVGAFVIYYRKTNCKRHLCWRLGHHDLTDPTDGVTRKLCWRHHPAVVHKHLSDEVIMKIHAKTLAATNLAAHNERLLKEIHRHVADARTVKT